MRSVRKTHCVYREHDNGERVQWTPACTNENASLLAGAFRDAMSERDVGDGYNFIHDRTGMERKGQGM